MLDVLYTYILDKSTIYIIRAKNDWSILSLYSTPNVMSQSVSNEYTASEVGKNTKSITCILILHPNYILLVVNILISPCFGSFLVFSYWSFFFSLKIENNNGRQQRENFTIGATTRYPDKIKSKIEVVGGAKKRFWRANNKKLTDWSILLGSVSKKILHLRHWMGPIIYRSLWYQISCQDVNRVFFI